MRHHYNKIYEHVFLFGRYNCVYKLPGSLEHWVSLSGPQECVRIFQIFLWTSHPSFPFEHFFLSLLLSPIFFFSSSFFFCLAEMFSYFPCFQQLLSRKRLFALRKFWVRSFKDSLAGWVFRGTIRQVSNDSSLGK